MNDELMNANATSESNLSELVEMRNDEETSERSQTVGEILESARKNRNLTIQQVSEQLKLSPKQIIALESNHFHLLPTQVIVRGFIRAYAKMLRIDSNPILQLLPQELEEFKLEESLKPALSTPFVESKLSLLGSSDTNKKYMIGVVSLVILVGFFYIVQSSYVSNFLSSLGKTSKETESVDLKNQKDAVAIKSLPTPVALTEKEKELSVDLQHQKSLTTIENEKLTLSEQALPSAEKINPISPNNNLLVLKFRENSWIQIKAENGSVLAERLVVAGSEEKYLVNQVLKLKIGNAAGVDGFLRGESLQIAPINGSNVINISIK